MSTQLAFGTDFARHAGNFAGERVELVHHSVDGVFKLKDLALHIHCDFARQVASGDGGRHLGNVADLGRQVTGHGIHRVGEIFPGAGNADDDSLAAQFAVRADFASHTRHFGSKRAQLIHHGVDGFFKLENFAAHIDGDFAGKIAAGNSSSDFSDVAYLAGKVAGHRVDGIGQILPCAGDARDQCLTTQLAVSADFARHARHLGSEDAELLNHSIDNAGRTEELAFQRTAVNVQANGLGQISLGDGRDCASHLGGWTKQVLHQRVHRNFNVAPRASGFMKTRALACSSFFANDLPNTFQFLSHLLVRSNN